MKKARVEHSTYIEEVKVLKDAFQSFCLGRPPGRGGGSPARTPFVWNSGENGKL